MRGYAVEWGYQEAAIGSTWLGQGTIAAMKPWVTLPCRYLFWSGRVRACLEKGCEAENIARENSISGCQGGPYKDSSTT
jgi:hypothetical protein